MQKVKSIFFLTEGEVHDKQKELSDPYIDHLTPHFEMEDGTIIWGRSGGPACLERWHKS